MSDEIDAKRKFGQVTALVIVLGLVSLLILQFVMAKETPAKKNRESAEIDMFRRQLTLIQTDNLAQRERVEEKIQAWETMTAVCETVTPPTVNPNKTPQFSPWTPPPFETGIFEGQPGALYHAFEAKIENHWKGIVNGYLTFVIAGAWISDPDQGFISVRGGFTRGKGYFPSPTKSGALRIVGVQEARLVIQQANDEKMLFFDVPALSYVNSLDATVVPITPTEILETAQPTSTPYPVPLTADH